MDDFPKVGFIGWNPFQFLHVKELAKAIPGAVFIIEKRSDYVNEFSDEILYNTDIPVIIWDRAKMAELDGLFDILICQTLFFRIETFVRTKIVMIQYGYAKEPHNYGAWRSLGDLCLTYGDYATKKISPFSPSVSVGNPRYDKWHHIIRLKEDISSQKENTDNVLEKILYVPTWGDLSSIDNYLDAVINLSQNYTVMLKLHHNTDFLEGDRKNKVNDRIHYFGANDDILELINEADMIISDYSGAIFDAVYFKKPIILLNNPNHYENDSVKMDSFSLEYAMRHKLGYEVNNVTELEDAISKVSGNKDYYSEIHESLRNELFTDTGNSIELAMNAIYDLEKGVYSLSQHQLYVRAINQELLATKRQLNIALKNKNK